MGTQELRKRDIWQDSSGGKATVAEKKFEEIFLQEFEDSDFSIRPKPKEFNDIYSKIELVKKYWQIFILLKVIMDVME